MYKYALITEERNEPGSLVLIAWGWLGGIQASELGSQINHSFLYLFYLSFPSWEKSARSPACLC